MGLLVDGVWHDQLYDTSRTGGSFVRKDSQFRNWVTADGTAGPTGRAEFKAEADRYHLYVSLACPWAHRTLIFRKIKALEGLVSISVVHWLMAKEGWTFATGDGVVPDSVNGATRLFEIYTKADTSYSGRVTVPVLWDKKTRTIVNNESSEIIRMFNSAFDGLGASSGDYYPSSLRGEIDTVNARVYDTVNNGVYKSGLASTQAAYDEAVGALFDTLDWIEGILGQTPYLTGDAITEADWRLFTTLVRFDAVYSGLFKCDKRRIADYPNLSHYLKALYEVPGIKETVNLEHIRTHYYWSLTSVNPSQIIPVGPELPFLK